MADAPGLAEVSPTFLTQLEARPDFERPLTEGGVRFDLNSEYEPAGDQPQAITATLPYIEEQRLVTEQRTHTLRPS